MLDNLTPCILCGHPVFGGHNHLQTCSEPDCRDLDLKHRLERWNRGVVKLREELMEFLEIRPKWRYH